MMLVMREQVAAPRNFMLIAAFGGLCLLACVTAFLGWIVQGPDMFLTMVENGMSWCF